MCKRIVTISVLLSLMLIATDVPAFHLTERLDYDLQWFGLNAGTSMLHIFKDENGVRRIVSSARSAEWVDIFYPVRDRAESVVEDARPWYPKHYLLKTKEGSHRKDKEVLFKRDEGKAIFMDNLHDKEREYEIPREIFDPLSSFYHVRFLDFEIGKSLYIPVFDSEKIWNVEVEVLKRETVTVPAGTFETILIKPLLKSEGIFSKKGEMYIWLTDDEKRIPVKLKTKVAVGSITAELTKIAEYSEYPSDNPM